VERAGTGAAAGLVAGVAGAPVPPPPVPCSATARIAPATSMAEKTQSTTLWRGEFIV
jgi:hypothetical protein